MNVVIVGAGIIGRSVAWRLAAGGAQVTVVDPDPGQAAAQVAAGMLAPVTEAHYGEEVLLDFTRTSALAWPRFARDLHDATGIDPGYVECGTVAVARDTDDLAALDDLHHYQLELGLASERLTSREVRRLEPALGPAVRGGLHVADDHQVDPRRALVALAAAGKDLGVAERTAACTAVTAGGVDLDDGGHLDADEVVVAAGWAAATLVDVPVRPVKGQILRLRASGRAVGPRRVVRGLDVYVTPRPDGEIVVGATQEDVGEDWAVTAGAVHDLLHAAWELLPGVAEAELVECAVGFRPATPDNRPVIGRVDGTIVATGHHRNGVLLAPVTADLVAAAVLGDADFDAQHPLAPQRFGGM